MLHWADPGRTRNWPFDGLRGGMPCAARAMIGAMASTFRISRSTTISAPPERIHALLDDFREWQKWSPWEGLDPAMTRDYSDPSSGVGASYSWKGNRKAGTGRMEMLESSPQHVAAALDFSAPMRAKNRVDFTLTPSGPTTTVEWAMSGPQNAVMRVMSTFWSMEKMIGPDFERGLAQLKQVAETG